MEEPASPTIEADSLPPLRSTELLRCDRRFANPQLILATHRVLSPCPLVNESRGRKGDN
jgi:hypothetical protein